MVKWLIAAVIVLFPGFAFASLALSTDGLALSVDGNTYRLRSAERPWRLSAFSSQEVVGYKNLFLSYSSDGELSYTEDGLGYLPTVNAPKYPAKIIVFSDYVLSFDSVEKRLYISEDGISYSLTTGLDLDSDTELQIVEAESGLSFFTKSASGLESYHLSGLSWIKGQLTPSATILSSGKTSLIALDNSNSSQLWFWRDDLWIELTVVEPVTSAQILGERVFLVSSSGTRELDVAGGAVTEAIDPSPSPVIIGNDYDTSVVILGSKIIMSKKLRSYQEFLSEFVFDRFLKTPNGYIFYQTGTAAVYFSPDLLTFNSRISAWSATSKIFDIKLFQKLAIVELSNSSGKTNIYRSDDYINWKRITLPAKPTYRVSLAQARGLDPGTLVEISGYQSVLTNVVAANVIYLQDDDAGIQVYLSASAGNLPSVLGRRYLIDGEISSSGAKRVVVDDLSDIIYLGSSQPLVWAAIGIRDLAKYQGRLIKTQATIGGVKESLASIVIDDLNTAIHFNQASDMLSEGDEIEISGVADWSSINKRPEIWYDQHAFQYLSRKTESEDSSETVLTQSELSESAASPIKTVTVKTSTIKEVPIVIERPLVATTSSEPSRSTDWVLLFLGFVTGLLVSRGKRLGSFLLSS